MNDGETREDEYGSSTNESMNHEEGGWVEPNQTDLDSASSDLAGADLAGAD